MLVGVKTKQDENDGRGGDGPYVFIYLVTTSSIQQLLNKLLLSTRDCGRHFVLSFMII